jgi:hypothetical protein
LNYPTIPRFRSLSFAPIRPQKKRTLGEELASSAEERNDDAKREENHQRAVSLAEPGWNLWKLYVCFHIGFVFGLGPMTS